MCVRRAAAATPRDIASAVGRRARRDALARGETAPPAGGGSAGASALPRLRILEALSATGLRAIRYAKELPNVERVVANDMDAGAVEAIARNIAHNGVGGTVRGPTPPAASAAFRSRAHAAREQVVSSCADAVKLMQSAGGGYDVVDLDPYGAPTLFLDSAVQAVEDDGLLCVTATDLAVLAGSNMEVPPLPPPLPPPPPRARGALT